MAFYTWENLSTETTASAVTGGSFLAQVIKPSVNMRLTGLRMRIGTVTVGKFTLWAVAGAGTSKTFAVQLFPLTAAVVSGSYATLTGLSIPLQAGTEYAVVFNCDSGTVWQGGLRSSAEITTIPNTEDNQYASTTAPTAGTALIQDSAYQAFAVMYGRSDGRRGYNAPIIGRGRRGMFTP